MKKTKEDLIKENAELSLIIKQNEVDDLKRRTTLSGLLDSYEWKVDAWDNKKTSVIHVRDWLGISFLIGELKADADYAMCIQARDQLRNENEMLRMRIKDLEFPVKGA